MRQIAPDMASARLNTVWKWCLTRAVDRQCQNREKKVEGPTQTRTRTHLHTYVEKQSCTYPPTHMESSYAHYHHVRVSCRRMFVLVDSCQGCFGSSVWILCQTSLLSSAVESCGGARHCPRGTIWVSRHETSPKLRRQIQAPLL